MDFNKEKYVANVSNLPRKCVGSVLNKLFKNGEIVYKYIEVDGKNRCVDVSFYNRENYEIFEKHIAKIANQNSECEKNSYSNIKFSKKI